MRCIQAFLLAAAASIGWSAGPALAEDGVTPNTILLGQVAALDGPAAALGVEMRKGLLAAFGETNGIGGVKDHKIELISINDGYEPNQAITAAKKLIEENKVFALVGSVGTPTSAAVQPIATEAGVPFIGAFTGAEFLSDPYKPSVINLRASYFQETEAMVEHLTKDLGITRIGIFYQDDAFGQAGLVGVKRALGRRKLALVGEGTYERNTIAVKRALLSIKAASPEAVIMIGAYKPCAEFVKLARQSQLNATFVGISFVGSDALSKELGQAGAGVVVTQVVPSPQDSSIPAVAQYRAALAAEDPDAHPSYVGLEGYLVGRLVVAALNKIPGEVTRQALIDVMRGDVSFDLGGFELHYGEGQNRGSDRVFVTVLQPDGTFAVVDKLVKSAVETVSQR